MSALLLLFRKMLKNKWLVLCQFLGFVLFASLIAGIPIFTQGIMQKYLIQELEQIQEDSGSYPGRVVFSSYTNRNEKSQRFNQLKADQKDPYEDEEIQEFLLEATDGYYAQRELIEERAISRLKMPLQAMMHMVSCKPYSTTLSSSNDPVRQQAMTGLFTTISASENFFDHIVLTDGVLPSGTTENGIYEAIVSGAAVVKSNLRLGDELVLKDTTDYNGLEPITVKIVGIYEVADASDPYWLQASPDTLYENLIIDYNLFMSDFLYDGSPYFNSAVWYLFFDYHQIDVGDLYSILAGFELTKEQFNIASSSAFCNSYMAADTTLTNYAIQSKQISNMMWALYIPVIFMLCLYSFMISKMIIENDRNEIALLTSRGATRKQIVGEYLVQGILIGIFALLIGPWIAFLLSSVLGASNGFLEFTGRKALSLHVGLDAYQYAAVSVGISMASILIPATIASKTDIVGHKRSISRGGGISFWEKSCLDLICLGISGYGYYVFLQQRSELANTSGTSLTDPLLFVVPVFFILGCGLLFLRIYPWLIRLIYRIGRKLWSATSYMTLTQVGRGLKNYHFLMVFLIMTLSVGMYSSITARTLGNNATDHVEYMTGCDVILSETWPIDRRTVSNEVSLAEGADFASEDGLTYYEEPAFSKFESLDGVEHLAKVYTRADAKINTESKTMSDVYLMGINPYDFGMTTSIQSGLLDYHINEYLNIMTENRTICFVSSALLQDGSSQGLSIGDTINLGWAGSPAAPMVIGGVIDYWPGINPVTTPYFIVADLGYIQERINLEPYSIWVKLEDGATNETLYESMEANDVRVSSYIDATAEKNAVKNDPAQMTINGTLTLGFVICCFVCLFGFIIYWVLAIRQRTLQFGIFRAMGISTKNLVLMMVLEQFLTSVVAALVGVFIGFMTGLLFVPFFELSYDAAELVPPFRIISLLSDRMVIYGVVIFTVLIGLAVLGVILSRIKINQALKLGED